MYNRIYIFGASGSGASTLGEEVAKHLPHVNFDGDDYFWIQKFTKQRKPLERMKLLSEDLSKHKQWILSGAVCGWGDILKTSFDLVIFLYVPNDMRIQRLIEREIERYGEEVLPGGELHVQSKQFLEWASKYDAGGMEVRSKALHENWMKDITCPILRIEGCQSVEERVEFIFDFFKSNKKQND